MARRFFLRACAFVLACSLLSASSALAAPITSDTNLQYFNYNGKTIALVGTSASYLCHVTQPDREDSYCTWENHVPFFNDLQGKGLNKIRLWLALNHSPGSRPIDSPGTATHNELTPYTFEQPFKWDAANKFWNLDVWEQGFFDRVKQVVSDAQARGIIVEVTLFAPFDGAFENSPWNDRNNSPQGVNKSLSAEKYFTAYDNAAGTGDDSLGNQYVRTRQRAFISKMVSTLNSFDNFYWEIANEPDLANEDMTGTINWHKDMIQEVVNDEAPLAKKHMVAVNFSQAQTVNWAATQANVQLIDGHYVTISDFAGRPRYGAVEMIRNFLKPTQAGSVDKTFGFNEGRISPNITGADENSVRAEAWEFMLNEGGSFDHLGYEWKGTAATNIRSQLGVLAKFLNGEYSGGVLVTPGLTLRNVSRQIMNPVSWCPDIAAYGAGNTYWGAMQWTRNEHALYIHHSTLSTGSFKKYDPIVTGGGYSHNFRLSLGSLAGNFTARWLDPKTGLDVAAPHNFFWPANGTLYQLPPSPTYNYDILLYVKRQ